MKIKSHNAILYVGALAAPLYFYVSVKAAPFTGWYLMMDVPSKWMPWGARALIGALSISMLVSTAGFLATLMNLVRRWWGCPCTTYTEEACCASITLLSSAFLGGYLSLFVQVHYVSLVLLVMYSLTLLTRIEFLVPQRGR